MTSDHPVKRRKKLIEVAILLEAGREPPGQSGHADARIHYSEGLPRNVIVTLANQEIAKIRHLTGKSKKHPFRVMKQQFGFQKTRLCGMLKNRCKVNVLAALANLFMVRHELLCRT